MLGVEEANIYATHAFRRGHARQLLLDGARLCEILAAGEWASSAFRKYIDEEKLEHDAVMEAHVYASESSGQDSEGEEEGSTSDDQDSK